MIRKKIARRKQKRAKKEVTEVGRTEAKARRRLARTEVIEKAIRVRRIRRNGVRRIRLNGVRRRRRNEARKREKGTKVNVTRRKEVQRTRRRRAELTGARKRMQ